MAQEYTLKTEVKYITDLFSSSKMIVKSNEIEKTESQRMADGRSSGGEDEGKLCR